MQSLSPEARKAVGDSDSAASTRGKARDVTVGLDMEMGNGSLCSLYPGWMVSYKNIKVSQRKDLYTTD